MIPVLQGLLVVSGAFLTDLALCQEIYHFLLIWACLMIHVSGTLALFNDLAFTSKPGNTGLGCVWQAKRIARDGL